jgi:hypothetical protein
MLVKFITPPDAQSRYAFRSTEKVALQEIGPRFTLKLKSLRKGLPAVQIFGEPSKPLEFDEFDEASDENDDAKAEQIQDAEDKQEKSKPKTKPPATDEYQWQWKVSCDLIQSSAQWAMLSIFLYSLSWKPPDAHSFCSVYLYPCLTIDPPLVKS